MASIPTLASMMLQLDPGIQPYSDALLKANRIQGGRVNNQTALLQLQDLQRQQSAAADVRQLVQQDPSLLFGGGGQPSPVLATLGGGGGPPGAITQSPMAGMPGATQTIPAPQDLSQFATGGPAGGMPQPTLATLGAPASPQDRLMALARTNPEAALLLQQRMQQQEDRRWKLQEQQLTMGTKVMEYVTKQAQGVRDQASLDALRVQLQQSGLDKYAMALPQMYTAEAMEAFISRGQTALENAQAMQARATALKTEQQAQTERYTRETFLPQLLREPGTTGAPTGAAAPTGGAAMDTSTLAPGFVQKMGQVESRLGMQQGDLGRLIHFETGGTFDPAVKNRAGSGATGLIQFMPDTAKALGTTTEALAKMSPEQQLEYVEKYLSQYKGKIGNLQDAYMAILYPKAIGHSGNYKLFTKEGDPTAYRQNAGLDTEGKGYVTVSDAVAAVQRTTGGLARGQGGATARGPAASSARVAAIEQQIAKKERDALGAAALGNEGLATQLRSEIASLKQERDRLEEIPRAVEKEQALQPLKIEQMTAAELAKAAPQEMIDAINRGRPASQQIPYGTKLSDLREKGLVGGALVPKPVLDELSGHSTVIQLLEDVSANVGALPTGPMAGRLEAIKERFGIDVTDEKVAQRQILTTLSNSLLQARSGAAINAHEYERIKGELPGPDDPPQVFKSRLATATRLARNLYKTKAQTFRKGGYALSEDLMEPIAAAEPAPAPKTSTNVDKFKAIQP